MSRRRRLLVSPPAAGPVPEVLRLGRLIEVWSATGEATDAGSAFGAHSRARLGWCRAQGLDTHGQMRVLGPSSGPWTLSAPGGLQRLADLGHPPGDVPALRIAAHQLVLDHTDTPRRSTP